MFCYPPGICNCGRNQTKHWTQLASKLIHFLQLHAFEDWCQQKTSNVSKWTDHSWPSLCIVPHVRHPCLGTDHASSSYNMLNITGVIPRADAFTFFCKHFTFSILFPFWFLSLFMFIAINIIGVVNYFCSPSFLICSNLGMIHTHMYGMTNFRVLREKDDLFVTSRTQASPGFGNIPNHEFVAGDQSIL